MRLYWLVLVGWLIAIPATAQSIPVSQVKVVGSSAAVLGFPATATFDSFSLVPGTMTIRTSGTAIWPAVAIEPNGAPVQSGTLWVFLHIGGQWYATGAERLRPTQLNGGKPEGSPTDLIGAGWLYDVNRWGPMAGYNPAPGEIVGVMVVAGSTRSDNQTPVKERTNILAIKWPNASGANPVTVVWSEGETPLPDPPTPLPTPVPPTPPSPTPPPSDSDTLVRIEHKIDNIATSLEEHRVATRNFADKVVSFLKDPRTILTAAGVVAGWFAAPGGK